MVSYFISKSYSQDFEARGVATFLKVWSCLYGKQGKSRAKFYTGQPLYHTIHSTAPDDEIFITLIEMIFESMP